MLGEISDIKEVVSLSIRIGDAVTFRDPETWGYTFDDRQERIEIIGGVYVSDYGYTPEGDTITCDVVLSKVNFDIVLNYWTNRTPVNITDVSGEIYANRRVLVKSYQYVAKFPDFVYASLEFWAK